MAILEPRLAQESKLCLLHTEMPFGRRQTVSFCGVFSLVVVCYTCSGLLCCFCRVERPIITSVLGTAAGSLLVPSCLRPDFCCQSSLAVSALVPACLAGVVGQVPAWQGCGVQVDYTMYWYFAFSTADFSKGLGLILALCFWHQGITHGMLLLTWVCSKSRQHTDNGRLNCLLFLVTIFS